MSFDPESEESEQWADAILTWAQVENVPEEILGYVCFSNFLASIREDISAEASWSVDMQERYLEACCSGHEAHMNIVRWAASSRDYMEGLYAVEISSWAVFEARDVGLYQVALEILGNNFDQLDAAKDLAEEIRKKTLKKPALADPNVN